MDSLFDINSIPLAKRPRRTRPLPARFSDKDMPLWGINVGTVTEYVRAMDTAHAIARWHDRHPTLSDEVIHPKRMLHADFVELERLDPKLARALRSV